MTVDFSQVNNSEVVEERERILAEHNASEELVQLANLLEANSTSEDSLELIELAHLTADQNPVSEAAFDLKERMTYALVYLNACER